MKQGTLIFLPATMLACLAAVYPESLVRILAAWTSATFCWVAADTSGSDPASLGNDPMEVFHLSACSFWPPTLSLA